MFPSIDRSPLFGRIFSCFALSSSHPAYPRINGLFLKKKEREKKKSSLFSKTWRNKSRVPWPRLFRGKIFESLLSPSSSLSRANPKRIWNSNEIFICLWKTAFYSPSSLPTFPRGTRSHNGILISKGDTRPSGNRDNLTAERGAEKRAVKRVISKLCIVSVDIIVR